MDDENKILQVTVVDRNGRRRYDPISKERLVASCLEPGASVAKFALEHGVNANLLWKWIRQRGMAKQETFRIPPPSASMFVPVHIEASMDEVVSRRDSAVALDSRPRSPGVRPLEPEGTGALSSPAKVNASLPNGVKLTLECGDVRAVTAIIGVLCDVQAGC
jgi:transposase